MSRVNFQDLDRTWVKGVKVELGDSSSTYLPIASTPGYSRATIIWIAFSSCCIALRFASAIFSDHPASSPSVDPGMLLLTAVFVALIPFGWVFWLFSAGRKNTIFIKQMQQLNRGREVVVLSEGIAISTGELLRGAENTSTFRMAGVTGVVRKNQLRYLYLRFEDLSSTETNGACVVFRPKNGALFIFRIYLGGAQDVETRNKIEQAVRQNCGGSASSDRASLA